MRVGELTLEGAAKEAAGNWQRFPCFAWFRRQELIDPEAWSVIYTHHRDSGLLAQSNAEVVAKALAPFTAGNDPDVVLELHSHWAVGHIDGFSIRVFRDGEITQAFQAYHDRVERMDDYLVLDETDFSNREYEATVENIGSSAWMLKNNYDLPADWPVQVYSWLSDHRGTALENTDDQGGFPNEQDLEVAFGGLGYPRLALA